MMMLLFESSRFGKSRCITTCPDTYDCSILSLRSGLPPVCFKMWPSRMMNEDCFFWFINISVFSLFYRLISDFVLWGLRSFVIVLCRFGRILIGPIISPLESFPDCFAESIISF